MKNTISGVFRAVMCLAFVMAVLLFPPVALHGQAAVSDGQQVATYDTDQAIHDHGKFDGMFGHCSASVSNADGGIGANQCCENICESFVLEEGHSASTGQTLFGHEIALHAQMVAYDPGVFLRPPKT